MPLMALRREAVLIRHRPRVEVGKLCRTTVLALAARVLLAKLNPQQHGETKSTAWQVEPKSSPTMRREDRQIWDPLPKGFSAPD